jgi:hypothetical protein
MLLHHFLPESDENKNNPVNPVKFKKLKTESIQFLYTFTASAVREFPSPGC